VGADAPFAGIIYTGNKLICQVVFSYFGQIGEAATPGGYRYGGEGDKIHAGICRVSFVGV